MQPAHFPVGALVALRKESVDRNLKERNVRSMAVGSLSARRAWIEIVIRTPIGCVYMWSLSARRAWIEMLASRLADMSAAVALRKESVDRNERS